MLTETRNEGTKSSEAVLQAAAQRLREADAVLVGASNGFSITEGLNLFAQDEAFEAIFGDFSRTYGIRSILHGMSVRWPDDAHYWAFWSRLIDRYTVGYEPSRVMRDLFALLEGKDAFILTTNGEGHFFALGRTRGAPLRTRRQLARDAVRPRLLRRVATDARRGSGDGRGEPRLHDGVSRAGASLSALRRAHARARDALRQFSSR